ncbi:MAG: VWA domain-containing protein [Planctomycetes bacterium]|nr:VWA domain-containing protein [Planctomycetota bacterium]
MRRTPFLVPLLTLATFALDLTAQTDVTQPIISRRPQVGVQLETERVNIQIADGIAHTKVTQVYRNQGMGEAEHTFLFPIPGEAVLGDFALHMNGKPIAGEVLDREKARGIYEDIVRRRRDPGLLEYLGKGLIRARIFPIPPRGTMTVDLTYTTVTKPLANLREVVHPMNRKALCNAPIKSLVMEVTLKSARGLKTIFSPTHAFDVQRKGNHEAHLSFEANDVLPVHDVQIVYGEEAGSLGMSAITFRSPDKDGYFLLFLSPSVKQEGKALAKDIVFVVDTSGSMAGEKMEQVQKALTYCIDNLGQDDRFAIVPFSTEARTFRDELVGAGAENIGAARTFVQGLQARGGTNIDEALAKAFELRPDEGKRPYFVVFLTDGLPTIGITDGQQILKNVAAKNTGETRIFAFGVGDDVNTKLIDNLAEATRADREYVRPGEDLELRITSLYDKVSSPVATDLKLSFENLKTYDVYPKALPDLFHGSQLVVVGRYEGSGARAIRLKGMTDGVEREWVYEANFTEDDAAQRFIAPQWAYRKVAFLLDEINRSGQQSPELIQEITQLGKEFGFVTPYTSYLVVEETERLAGAMRVPARRFAEGGDLPAITTLGVDPQSVAHLRRALDETVVEEVERADQSRDALRSLGYLESGTRAVQNSLRLQMLRKETASEFHTGFIRFDAGLAGARDGRTAARLFMRRVDERIFHLVNSVWVESTFSEAKRDGVKKLVAFSPEYFEFTRQHADLGKILALGDRVLFQLNGTFYEITPPSE